MEVSMEATPASDLLRSDHRQIESYLDSLLGALKHLSASCIDGIKQDFGAIQQIAGIHFEREERVFYPVLRSQAAHILAQMDQEHEVVRETELCLGEFLESLPITPVQRNLDELRRLGIEFHDAIQVHIIDEEDQLLKLADTLLSGEEQQRMATAMLKISSIGK
jgi:hemerythrin-like domain-containing protein